MKQTRPKEVTSAQDEIPSALVKAFDPETFRRSAKQMVDRLADFLGDVERTSVTQYRMPEQSLEQWSDVFANGADDWWQLLIEDSIHLNHPHYMGHQISPTLPVTAIAGMLSDVLNNGMGVYEMGQGATAIEHVLVDWVAKQLGMGNNLETPGGFLTSGGTLGNLTALLAARRQAVGHDVWREGTGITNGDALGILVSEQSHYCVERAARIMGLGDRGVIKLPVNDRNQIRLECLDEIYATARSKNSKPFALVGNACTTSTGSFDDLNGLADFCHRHSIWFHVDGAHGASAAFSPQHAHLVAGIERADSVVMDFHKTMMTPALATGLIFKNYQHAYQSFSQQADYLWDSAESEEWYELTKRTFECTKYMMSIKIFSIIQTHGAKIFCDYIDRVFGLGKRLAELVAQHPSFELAMQPDCNIVCFRYGGPEMQNVDDSRLSELNREIRKQVLKQGKFYIVQTVLGDRLYLRTTLTNPFTTAEHLRELLQHIELIANTLKVA